LLEALNEMYAERPRAEPQRPSTGHVSLVGAGPGDPGLLTRRAIARLRGADLVLYDALVDDRVLRYASRAQRFFVGKRAGRHAVSQQTIQAVMIRAARRGRYVVRLKGGDPFVFGRGGEEALALERAGVAFEIVPGITSALAAPALAGIPMTHRGVASAFLVVSGHDERVFASAIGGLEPNGVTVVVLMGLGRSADLAKLLVKRGWAAATPSAAIFDASCTAQRVWRGTLSDLAAEDLGTGQRGAATIVIGEVARMGTGAAGKSKRTYVNG
jgi:uroporphyrin-III C-methyltransferase/precorrin-2 dehydrogenase/sirohydrochlorin ferrochelatase